VKTLTLLDYAVNSPAVAVLYAHSRSNYKLIPGLDVYDIDRDARTFSGGRPVIAHPPCRSWGKLRQFSKPRQGERDLAGHALDQVRSCGGVLEHPSGSSLWDHFQLPTGKSVDSFGGFTLKVDQSHWGHPARKSTLLYICGCTRSDVPQMPLSFDCILKTVEGLSRKAREATPLPFAYWLIDLALRCAK